MLCLFATLANSTSAGPLVVHITDFVHHATLQLESVISTLHFHDSCQYGLNFTEAHWLVLFQTKFKLPWFLATVQWSHALSISQTTTTYFGVPLAGVPTPQAMSLLLERFFLVLYYLSVLLQRSCNCSTCRAYSQVVTETGTSYITWLV